MKSSTILPGYRPRWKSGRPFGRPVFYYSPVSVPSGRPNLWGTPDNPRLPGVRAVWLNTIRDVTFQTIGSDSAILSYRDRSKHRSGRDNS